MPGYVISHVKVNDPQEYRSYIFGFMKVIQPFDGRVLVATDEFEILEGEWPEGRIIVMEFPSTERAREWYKSSQYQNIASHRHRAATTRMVLVDGFSGHYEAKSQ
jgi:uncharacterized protein (DUF1330 family)